MTVYSRAARCRLDCARAAPAAAARSAAAGWRAVGEERADAVGLIPLDVEQEHVGRIGRHLNRELLEQAGLQRPDADDEERAEADRQQDDPRLVAGPRQMQHRMTQRERSRVRERRDDRRPARGPPGAARTPARKARAHDEADLAATPPARPRPRPARRRPPRSPRCRTQSRGWALDSSRSSSDGLMNRTCSSGTIENSSDTSAPMARPCSAALHVTPYSTSASSDEEVGPSASGMALTARRASRTPSRLPARPSVRTCRR